MRLDKYDQLHFEFRDMRKKILFESIKQLDEPHVDKESIVKFIKHLSPIYWGRLRRL